MKTEYTFGVRTASERYRCGKKHTTTWYCDNPNCQKIYHYSEYCPNTVPSMLSKWWYRILRKFL